MDLKAYLEYNKIPLRVFAHQINYHYIYVRRVMNKQQPPGRKFVQAVLHATNGAVTPYELFAIAPEHIERPVKDPSFY